MLGLLSIGSCEWPLNTNESPAAKSPKANPSAAVHSIAALLARKPSREFIYGYLWLVPPASQRRRYQNTTWNCIATSKKTVKATAARSEGAVPNKAAFTRRNLCYACHLASNLILQTAIPQTSVNIYKHRHNIYNHWLLWHCVPCLIKLVHLSIVVEQLLERDKVRVDTPPQTKLGKVLLYKRRHI